MAILEGGRIAQIGAPGEVYRRPTSRVVADFIGETNFIEGTVEAATDGTALVGTPIGRFEGIVTDEGWRPAAGERVTLSIRPEAWKLVNEAAGNNAVRGRIGDAVYLGEVAQYRFLSGEHSLKIFELNPSMEHLRTGGELSATVAREDVVVLGR
jgi:iron(III) transport system ATP-binding protein